MNNLQDRQIKLLNYLIAGDQAIFEHIVNKEGLASSKTQLQIYKNAYRLRLKEAIDTDHALLGVYLGDALFDQVVDGYIDENPSHYTSLREYADNFPAYLEETNLFTGFPTVPELAAFERTLLASFDAGDAAILTLTDLQSKSEADWPGLVFRFHPSVQCITNKSNAVEVWQALKTGSTPPEPVEGTNHWLVWRNAERLTEFRSLDDEELSLIKMILSGCDFSTLCAELLESRGPDIAGKIAFDYILEWADNQILRNI